METIVGAQSANIKMAGHQRTINATRLISAIEDVYALWQVMENIRKLADDGQNQEEDNQNQIGHLARVTGYAFKELVNTLDLALECVEKSAITH